MTRILVFAGLFLALSLSVTAQLFNVEKLVGPGVIYLPNGDSVAVEFKKGAQDVISERVKVYQSGSSEPTKYTPDQLQGFRIGSVYFKALAVPKKSGEPGDVQFCRLVVSGSPVTAYEYQYRKSSGGGGIGANYLQRDYVLFQEGQAPTRIKDASARDGLRLYLKEWPAIHKPGKEAGLDFEDVGSIILKYNQWIADGKPAN